MSYWETLTGPLSLLNAKDTLHNYYGQLKGLDSIGSFLLRKANGINKGEGIYYHINMFKIAKGNIIHNNYLPDELDSKPQGSTPAQATGPKGAK